MTKLTHETLLDGAWSGSSSGDVLAVLDPADLDSTVGTVPAMGPEDIAAAYAAAYRSAAGWRDCGSIQRGVVLAAAADRLRSRCDEISRVLVRENGKTLAEASVEVTKSADFLDYYAGMARLPYGELIPDARPGTVTSTRTEPVGPTLLITPWNDPILTPARKLAPALVAGNTVLLKPAPDTPLVALELARALHESGLPAGVLNVVTGRTQDLADALLTDRHLKAVSFTGSTATGVTLRRALADRTVRLQTEMGGKNASVVLADADLQLATTAIASAGFAQAGQRCSAASRVILAPEIAEEMLERLVAAAGSHVLGSGLEPEVTMGPLINPARRDAVVGHVARARDEGGRVLLGGRARTDGRLGRGCFVSPAVVTGVDSSQALWREEVFGPVLAVRVLDASSTGADGEQAALAAANDSTYGLAAAVYTRDLGAAYRFVYGVEAGQVSVNHPTSGWDVHHPFGGFGDSGSAFKEQGPEGLRFYTRVKTAAIRFDGVNQAKH